jgi:predicted  nucleic acid-binding Zn-ribbon protein
MADVETLVLEHLEHIRTSIERLAEDAHEIKLRLGHVETTVASVQARMAESSMRLDRIENRLDRIERHLDLPEF